LTLDKELSSIDLTEGCSVEEPPAKKQKTFDAEKIIIGEELSDAEINYAQRLLKEKHPKVNGLRTTLYKGKLLEIQDNVQIAHCTARHHWKLLLPLIARLVRLECLILCSLTVTKKLRYSSVVCISISLKIQRLL